LEERIGIRNDGRPRIAFNVNSYIDEWNQPRHRRALTRAAFISEIAQSFDRILRECEATPVFVVTQVMDTGMTHSVRAAMQLGHAAPIAAIGAGCDFRELTGLFQRVELLIAMRTHALILATSVHTPVVNLNTYPKSAAYMETIGQGAWSLNVKELTKTSLPAMACAAWQARTATRAVLEHRVPLEKAKAAGSAHRVRDLLAS
jgi:polysaccharide pyruvyl transferase WcaK-like protein